MRADAPRTAKIPNWQGDAFSKSERLVAHDTGVGCTTPSRKMYPVGMTLCDNRPMPLYAVAAVFVEDELGRVALQLRDNIPTIRDPNHWSLWGGQVELGETPLAAAARELGEELTLAVPEEALTLVCEHERGHGTPFHADWSVYRYRAGKSLDDAVVMEGQGLGRFGVSALTSETLEGRPVHPVIREVLADYLRARGAKP